jgi:hypothetical protein
LAPPLIQGIEVAEAGGAFLTEVALVMEDLAAMDGTIIILGSSGSARALRTAEDFERNTRATIEAEGNLHASPARRIPRLVLRRIAYGTGTEKAARMTASDLVLWMSWMSSDGYGDKQQTPTGNLLSLLMETTEWLLGLHVKVAGDLTTIQMTSEATGASAVDATIIESSWS